MSRRVLWRRPTHRLVHLVLAVALGAFVYSPLRAVPEAVLVVQGVLFPLVAVSGLVMWKEAQLRQWYRDR